MPSRILLPESLETLLRRFRNRQLVLDLVSGIALTLGAAAGLVAVSLAIDFLTGLPSWGRASLGVTAATLTLLTAAYTIIRPLVSAPSRIALATQIEQRVPRFQERLVTCVALAEPRPSASHVGAPMFQQRLLAETIQLVGQTDLTDKFDSAPVRRRIAGALAAIALLLLPLLLAGNHAKLLLIRFLNPWGNHPRVSSVALTIQDPDRTIGRGDDVSFSVAPSSRRAPSNWPDFIRLHWTSETGVTGMRRLDWNEGSQTYVGTIRDVRGGFYYSVAGAGAQTKRHQVIVLDRPKILSFNVTATLPTHSGSSLQVPESTTGRFEVIEQSELKIDVQFDEPVTSARLSWGHASRHESLANDTTDRQDALTVSADRQSATWSRTLPIGFPAGWILLQATGESGLDSATESICRLTVLPAVPSAALRERRQLAEVLQQVKTTLDGARDHIQEVPTAEDAGTDAAGPHQNKNLQQLQSLFETIEELQTASMTDDELQSRLRPLLDDLDLFRRTTGEEPDSPLPAELNRLIPLLRQAAESLTAVSPLLPGNMNPAFSARNRAASSGAEDAPGGDSSSLGSFNDGAASTVAPEIETRPFGPDRRSGWSQLSDAIQEELIRSSQRTPTGEYAPRIRSYFDRLLESPDRPIAE